MKVSEFIIGISADASKQEVDSGGAVVTSSPKVADEGALASPAPKQVVFPFYSGPLAAVIPNKYPGSLTL